MQAYSNPKRESEPTALPDVEVYQLTAEEIVRMDEDLMWKAMKRFPLATMNSREQQKAVDWAVEISRTTSAYYWHSCFPGCLPDGDPNGPFATREEALADAQSSCDDDCDDSDDDDSEPLTD